MLQEQVGHLAESQATTDDRYSKVKQENQTLTQKFFGLDTEAELQMFGFTELQMVAEVLNENEI